MGTCIAILVFLFLVYLAFKMLGIFLSIMWYLFKYGMIIIILILVCCT